MLRPSPSLFDHPADVLMFRPTPYNAVFSPVICYLVCVVGPCHHGMARLQVADRGTASDKEGSCE